MSETDYMDRFLDQKPLWSERYENSAPPGEKGSYDTLLVDLGGERKS